MVARHIEEGNMRQAIIMAKRTVSFTKEDMETAIQFIRLFGFRCLRSVDESDKLLAQLNLADPESLVYSSDRDCLVHGARAMVKYSIDTKNKLEMEELRTILDHYRIDLEQFVEICVLLGTDYEKLPPPTGLDFYGNW